MPSIPDGFSRLTPEQQTAYDTAPPVFEGKWLDSCLEYDDPDWYPFAPMVCTAESYEFLRAYLAGEIDIFGEPRRKEEHDAPT